MWGAVTRRLVACAIRSERVLGHLGARHVAGADDVQPGADLGQFIAEEVPHCAQPARVVWRQGWRRCRSAGEHGDRDVQPYPRQHHVPGRLHVGHCVGQRLGGLARGPGRLGGGADFGQRAGQLIGMRREFGPLHGALDGGVHAARQQLQAAAALHDHLAAQQVHRLDAVGAFVDHVEAVVAPVLLHREVARVAVAAVDLDGQGVGLQAPFAGPALGDGREHFQQQARLVGGFWTAGVLLVHEPRAIEVEGQGAFAIALLRQEHAPDVGVLDEAHGGCRGILSGLAVAPRRARHDRPALGAVLGVLQAGAVAGQAEHGGGHADADAGLVHHVEHALQAVARPAHPVADGARAAAVQSAGPLPCPHGVRALAEVEQRVGGAAPAELVVEAGQGHIVALARELPGGVDQVLGHDEERDAFHAGHQAAVRPGDLGQHEVDDVFGHLVVAGGDPHLVAGQAVARAERVGLEIVPVGHGARGDVGERGACLWLGEAHGAGPAPVEFVEREDFALRLGAVHHEQVGVADGEQVGADADRRFREEAVGRGFQGIGQLHAADGVILGRAQHAGFGIGPAGFVRGAGQHDAPVFHARLFSVHEAVERGVFLPGDALAGVEHGIEGFTRMVGESLPLRERDGIEPVVEQEVEGGTQWHGRISAGKGRARTRAGRPGNEGGTPYRILRHGAGGEGSAAGPGGQRRNGALRRGTELLHPIRDRIDLAPAHGLGPPAVQRFRPCDQPVAPGRPQVVDLELGGDHGYLQRCATRIGERVVGQVAHHAAVHEAVLLQQLRRDGQAQFTARRREGGQLGPQQLAEGLPGQHVAAMGEPFGIAARHGSRLLRAPGHGALRTLRTRRRHPCRHRCTSSRRRAWHRGGGLR